MLLFLVGCSAAVEPTGLSFKARAGDPCTKCDTCTTTAHTCVCDTCTDYAYDADAKVMLVCSDRGWTVYKKCPGGVSVSCTDGGYKSSCLDESGKEVP
jgi:hypothetical protein